MSGPMTTPVPPLVKPYGCWNRKPIVTVCKPTCQYTYTALGQADARCRGCRERFPGLAGERQP